MNERVTYLGDGLYVRFDGYGFWLLANHHEHPTDKVYLEPEVLAAFNAFVLSIEKESINAVQKG